jgi:flagellar hook-length control protein FliK
MHAGLPTIPRMPVASPDPASAQSPPAGADTALGGVSRFGHQLATALTNTGLPRPSGGQPASGVVDKGLAGPPGPGGKLVTVPTTANQPTATVTPPATDPAVASAPLPTSALPSTAPAILPAIQPTPTAVRARTAPPTRHATSAQSLAAVPLTPPAPAAQTLPMTAPIVEVADPAQPHQSAHSNGANADAIHTVGSVAPSKPTDAPSPGSATSQDAPALTPAGIADAPPVAPPVVPAGTIPTATDMQIAPAPANPPANPIASASPTAALPATLTAAAPSPAAQVAPALVALTHAPDGAPRLTLRLDPPELGLVQIRIERPQDAPARVEITVQRQETLTLLLRDQPQLQTALNQAGVPLDGRSITFHLVAPEPVARSDGSAPNSGTDFAGQSGNGADGASRQGGSAQQRSADGMDDNNDANFTPIAAPTWLRAGLDITA